MNDLVTFTNEQFGEIRAAEINGEPWFVGKDVCTVFGDTNYRRSLARLDDYDKTTIPMMTAGGMQEMIAVNESGLYSLLFYMQPQKAKGVSQNDTPLNERTEKLHKFKRWVTSEVLPTIRKTGFYSLTQKQDSYLIEDPIARAKRWIEEQEEKILLETKVVEQEKEIEYKEDVIIGLVDNISLADKRQILNRVVRYKHANYQERWSLLYREFENKYHLDLGRRVDVYNETHKPKCKTKLEYIDRVMNKIPELYELVAKLFENDVKELVQEMYDVA